MSWDALSSSVSSRRHLWAGDGLFANTDEPTRQLRLRSNRRLRPAFPSLRTRSRPPECVVFRARAGAPFDWNVECADNLLHGVREEGVLGCL